MDVRKYEVVSLSMCAGAYCMDNKIKSNTTPEEFDKYEDSDKIIKICVKINIYLVHFCMRRKPSKNYCVW